MKLVHADLAELRYCNKGARLFFIRHGLDWGLFLQEGVDIELIELIDDEMARAAVEQAKRRLGVL